MTRVPHLRHDSRGATLVEFAFVAPVMLLMLTGTFDLAHQAYAKAVLQGSVEKAGRDSGLEAAGIAGATTTMDDAILTSVRRVTGQGATYQVRRRSYTDFSKVNQPERFVDKPPLNNVWDTGECFEDENGNGTWDADKGRDGRGGADDVVLYSMTVSYPRLFPMAGLLGWSSTQQITATTILRNQPYANQNRPTVTACA